MTFFFGPEVLIPKDNILISTEQCFEIGLLCTVKDHPSLVHGSSIYYRAYVQTDFNIRTSSQYITFNVKHNNIIMIYNNVLNIILLFLILIKYDLLHRLWSQTCLYLQDPSPYMTQETLLIFCLALYTSPQQDIDSISQSPTQLSTSLWTPTIQNPFAFTSMEFFRKTVQRSIQKMVPYFAVPTCWIPKCGLLQPSL